MKKKILRILNKMLKKLDKKFFGGKLFRKRDMWAISLADKYPSLEYAFLRDGKPYIYSNGIVRFSKITQIAPSDLIWLQYNNPVYDVSHGRYDIVKAYCAYKNQDGLAESTIDTIVNINQNGVLLDCVDEVVKAFLVGQEKLNVRVNYIANIPIQPRMLNGENIVFANSLDENERKMYEVELNNLLQACQPSFYFFIWTPAMKYKDEILSELHSFGGILIQNRYDLNLTQEEASTLIDCAYGGADKPHQMFEFKKRTIIRGAISADSKYPVCVLKVKVRNPHYHFHPRSGCLISLTLDEIKRNLRTKWAPKIADYEYDNVVHSTDNLLQYKQMKLDLKNLFHINHEI